jgi:hypothetical protein
MARKVEKTQTYFLRPHNGAPTGSWELWLFEESRPGQFVKTLPNPSETPGDTVIALPARHTVSFLTWLSIDDRELIPNMLQLQLEQKGLLPRNGQERLMDYRIIESTPENHTLTLVSVLQPEFPKELTFDKATRFEPSAFTVPLPQDRVILWHEHGRIVVAATCDKQLTHFQILCDKKLSKEAIQELRCIIIELESHSETHRFLGVVLWGGFSEEEIESVKHELKLPLFQDEMPAPELPLAPSKLLPPQVAVLHAKRHRRERIKRVVTLVAAIYVLFLLSQILSLGWQHFQANQLRTSIVRQQPEVDVIRTTAKKWQNLQWAIDPKVYPVELLLQTASLLPGQGMRLTSFEIEKGKVVLHGEASMAADAFKFAEDIKSNPALKMFQWQMATPSLRPDGRADFIVEGEPTFAKTK